MVKLYTKGNNNRDYIYRFPKIKNNYDYYNIYMVMIYTKQNNIYMMEAISRPTPLCHSAFHDLSSF